MLAAFARGRRTQNLFGADLNTVLDMPVTEVQRSLGLEGTYESNVRDAVLFALVAVVAPAVALIPGVAAAVTSPWWLSEGAHRQLRR